MKCMFSEEQISEIVALYSSGVRGEDIAGRFNVPYKTMRKHLNFAGVIGRIMWTSEKIKWLKINYDKPYKEMSKCLGICEETIRLKINELGLIRTTRYRPYKIDTSDASFWEAIDNPRLTAPDIVEMFKDKYGFGESRVHQLRKERGIKLQINHLEHFSTAEKQVQKILDKADLAYFHSKRLGKFTVDFYLGNQCCIEVQGSYWHTKVERVERDNRKKDFLDSNNYKVLYVWEDEISEKIILDFIKSLGLPVLRSTENKPCERKQKRCVKKVS